MGRRTLGLVLVVVLVLSLVPAVAGAAPQGDPKEDDGISPLAANTATPDVYEPDGAGGSPILWDNLRDLGPLVPRWGVEIPGWGMDAYTEAHTIDNAPAATTPWDEDWWKLTVTAADFNDFTQLSYRIDAFTMDFDTDIVLDVYANGVSYAQANTVYGPDPLAVVSNDDAVWGSGSVYGIGGRWSSVTFIPPSAGIYWVRVRPYWADVPAHFSGHAGPYTLRIKYGQVMRLAGATRVDTAVRTAQEGWTTKPAKSLETSVVLAFSNNYPDALSAASLAGACGMPILLTPGDHLPVSVRNEIVRLGVKGAYVVGGTGVIANSVIEDLQVILDSNRIKRVAGTDRYKTSIEVLKETKAVLEGHAGLLPSTAFLVSGANFPDALAVGPMAYNQKVPVLLTEPATLTPAIRSAIAMYGFDDIIVAGGTGAVSANAVNALVDDGIPPNRILRVSGTNRYETAKEIAAWACDLKGPGSRSDGRVGTTNNTIALPRLNDAAWNVYASGEGYADALAGGPFAGKIGAPVLLTPKSVGTPFLFGADGEIPVGSSQWFADLALNSRLPIMQSYLLGGTGAVSNGVYEEIDNNTGWDPGF